VDLGVTLAVVACDLWCQKFKVYCGAYESTRKHYHSGHLLPTHTNCVVMLHILVVLKPLQHKAHLPYLFLAYSRDSFDIGNTNCEKEQIPPFLNFLSKPYFATWSINIFLIFFF